MRRFCQTFFYKNEKGKLVAALINRKNKREAAWQQHRSIQQSQEVVVETIILEGFIGSQL